MDTGAHTLGEKMDLNVRGSRKDTRHGTSPSIKHPMLDSHRQQCSEEEGLELSAPRAALPKFCLLLPVGGHLASPKARFPELQSGANRDCAECQVFSYFLQNNSHLLF